VHNGLDLIQMQFTVITPVQPETVSQFSDIRNEVISSVFQFLIHRFRCRNGQFRRSPQGNGRTQRKKVSPLARRCMKTAGLKIHVAGRGFRGKA
jgi:hypothetical protein